MEADFFGKPGSEVREREQRLINPARNRLAGGTGRSVSDERQPNVAV